MIEFAFAAALMAQDAENAATAPASAHRIGRASQEEMEESLANVDWSRVTISHADWPRCFDLENNEQHENCDLLTSDGRTLWVTFTFDHAGPPQAGRMRVHSAEGQSLQVFDFQTESFFYPSLDDVNADGFQDIRIPLITGNVNTEYAIFFGTEDGFTHQPWQVSGFAVEAANDNGLIVARSRSSAAESFAEFYRFDGERVTGEATVLLSFMNVENPDDGPDCSLVDGGETEGEAYYCGLALNR